MKPHEKAPVAVGEKFTSMRNGATGVVEKVKHFSDVLGWAAYVRIGGKGRWVTCSKNGIKGYRRAP